MYDLGLQLRPNNTDINKKDFKKGYSIPTWT